MYGISISETILFMFLGRRSAGEKLSVHWLVME